MRIIGLLRDVAVTVTIIIPIGGMCVAVAEERAPIAGAVAILSGGGTQLIDPENRMKAASSIEDFCRPVAQAIPTLSPREQDWLNTEINSPRATAAYDSIEYSKLFAGRSARACVSLTERIREQLQSNAQSYEMSLWAMLAGRLIDPIFKSRVNRLQQAGVVQFRKEITLSLAISEQVGRDILGSIVVPYLANEAGATLAPDLP